MGYVSSMLWGVFWYFHIQQVLFSYQKNRGKENKRKENLGNLHLGSTGVTNQMILLYPQPYKTQTANA